MTDDKADQQVDVTNLTLTLRLKQPQTPPEKTHQGDQDRQGHLEHRQIPSRDRITDKPRLMPAALSD